MVDALTITCPDDWHVHFRDGAALGSVVPDTARRFARAIVMPNLDPPVIDCQMATAYRERILRAVPPGIDFEPLMTLYFTDETTPEEIVHASESAFVHAVKLYPAGATTNSSDGVTDVERVYPALERMQAVDLPLLVHGEVVDARVDVFDRERAFIDRVLLGLTERFPALRIVFEHITTRDAVEFVRESPDTVAATITAHHLLLNRNALFEGGVRPHHYCLPVLKREDHRQALLEAATGGSEKFFLGTDSAPHAKYAKETTCGCAGIYTAHAAIELYAEAFDAMHALERLEGFASRHGPAFYGLPVNDATLTLARRSWKVPREIAFGESTLVPFRASSNVAWAVGTS